VWLPKMFLRTHPASSSQAGELKASSPEAFQNTSLNYNLCIKWDADDFTLPHQPRYRLTQGTRLINPAIFRDLLAKSIPPGEQVNVQDKQDVEISDIIATTMAYLHSHSVEAMRHAEINQGQVRKLNVDYIKIKDELADAKKHIEQLTLSLAQEVTNREAAEVQLSSADESLVKEIMIKGGVRGKTG
jgi:hypothetical protein